MTLNKYGVITVQLRISKRGTTVRVVGSPTYVKPGTKKTKTMGPRTTQRAVNAIVSSAYGF
jgi:hypothetical protein